MVANDGRLVKNLVLFFISVLHDKVVVSAVGVTLRSHPVMSS